MIRRQMNGSDSFTQAFVVGCPGRAEQVWRSWIFYEISGSATHWSYLPWDFFQTRPSELAIRPLGLPVQREKI